MLFARHEQLHSYHSPRPETNPFTKDSAGKGLAGQGLLHHSAADKIRAEGWIIIRLHAIFVRLGVLVAASANFTNSILNHSSFSLVTLRVQEYPTAVVKHVRS